MAWTELLISQLTDIFRIGLVIGLLYTAFRTRDNTGLVVPLLLGVVFVALIIPMTMPGAVGEPLWRQALVGIVANLILLGASMAVWTAIRRLRP